MSGITAASAQSPQSPQLPAYEPAQSPAAWMEAMRRQVDAALDAWCTGDAPASLAEPMRYAVAGGGKRLRPLLALAARAAVAHHDSGATHATDDANANANAITHPRRQTTGAQTPSTPSAGFDAAALRAACALEMIHAYSLVHDDMPCMDNDVLRRGQPTVHVRFGEAAALLAGDALQACAFELLTPDGADPASGPAFDPALQALLCRSLAQAAGGRGMAGGQAIDLASVGGVLDEAGLRHMHELKTGALLRACVTMGGACGQAPASAIAALARFGAAIGLAFQIVDDILDVVGDAALLGKTAGKDAAHGKPTYVSVLGLAAARDQAAGLRAEAMAALSEPSLGDTSGLAALATMVTERSS